MLPFFNQKELVVCSNQSQYQKYTSLLEKAGITYRTKARDLSSPSLFSMGTRERTGTTFQKVNYQMLYTIYVRKADYERAVHVILARTAGVSLPGKTKYLQQVYTIYNGGSRRAALPLKF